MMFLTLISSLLFLTSCPLLYFSVRKNLQFLETIEQFSEQVEESIVILDHHLSKIEKKSKLEIMIDDPIVRELVEDIKKSKEAVSLVKEKIAVLVEESE